MSGLELLELVAGLMPVAFFADVLLFTFGVWWGRRWRQARSKARS